MPVSEPTISRSLSSTEYRIGRSPLRSMAATTQRPSVAAIAAGPSHGSMTQLR